MPRIENHRIGRSVKDTLRKKVSEISFLSEYPLFPYFLGRCVASKVSILLVDFIIMTPKFGSDVQYEVTASRTVEVKAQNEVTVNPLGVSD